MCCSIIWTGCEINGGNPTMALFALLQTRYPFDETMPKLSSTNASSTTGIITLWKFNYIFQHFFWKMFFFLLKLKYFINIFMFKPILTDYRQLGLIFFDLIFLSGLWVIVNERECLIRWRNKFSHLMIFFKTLFSYH